MPFLNWTSNLPSSWKAKPLRAVATYMVSNVDKIPLEDEIPIRLCNYSDVYNNEFISLKIDFMRSTATETEIDKFKLNVGDVVITKDSESWDDIGIPSLIKESADDLLCGYHLAIIRPNSQSLFGPFLLRVLQSKNIRIQLELSANGVTRFGIPKSEIGSMKLPVPPISQQRSIANYLDRETARIDSLIAAKEHWLNLLAEKRRALITHAVTRGCDPKVPLKDSGIPWLGKIPKHWNICRLAWQFKERDLRNMPELPLLEVSINKGVIQREFSDDKIEGVASDFNMYKVAYKNDIVFNKMRMWQGAVGVSPMDGLVSPDYTVAEPIGDLLPDYTGQLFRTALFSTECSRHSHGIVWDRLRLYWEGFREIEVPVPPRNEQVEIMKHIQKEVNLIDKLSKTTEDTISLLKERRTTLISEVVSGQKQI